MHIIMHFFHNEAFPHYPGKTILPPTMTGKICLFNLQFLERGLEVIATSNRGAMSVL